MFFNSQSPDSILNKLRRIARRAGAKIIVHALVLLLVLQSSDAPPWAKAVIICALAYLINPVDAIPDVLVPLGYTDDLATLIAAIATVGAFVTQEIVEEAQSRARLWFGDLSDDELKIGVEGV